MPNLLLGALACAACILAGAGIRRHYSTRCDAIDQWRGLLLYLQEQIAFRLTPLPTILADYAATRQDAVALAFKAYPEMGRPQGVPDKQWQTMVQQMRSLGKSDAAGQSGRLALALAQADEWRQQAKQDLAQKGNLYAKLCVLGGLALWVVMI